MNSEIMCPAFTKCGSIQLTVSELNSTSKLKLSTVSADTPLGGIAEIHLSGALQTINKGPTGFVTIGRHRKGKLFWNREWCRMDGEVLKFWGTPSEEVVNSPKWCLDLKSSLSQEVDIADRSVCVRRRALLLEIMHEADQSVPYLLEVDTAGEVEAWKNGLNSVISSLAAWKELKFPAERSNSTMV